MVDPKFASARTVTDKRFSHVHNDPRFQKMAQRKKKVKVDPRFKHMFTDPEFNSTISAPTDKYGRKKKAENGLEDDLRRFYHQDSDSAEEKIEETMDEKLERLNRMARGEASGSSSSEEDDFDLDDNVETEADVKASRETIPDGDASKRLALVNCNWDNLKAEDLFAIFYSFKPQLGELKSVSVYPSEYGLKQMARDNVFGPSIWDDKNDDGENDDVRNANLPEPKFYKDMDLDEVDEWVKEKKKKGKEVDDVDASDGFNKEKLRQWELNKLRYYFAVIEFDSAKTAQVVYDQCDGMEFEASSTELDLRFIPDDLEMKHEPRDRATETRSNYKPPFFVTKALQHSNVDLTWDTGDRDRAQTLSWRPALDAINEDDYAAYLAPVAGDSSESDSSDDEDRDETEALKLEKMSEKERKKYLRKKEKAKKKKRKAKRKAERIKYKNLLFSRLAKGGGEEVEEMEEKEITFKPGLAKKLEKDRLARQRDATETVFERKQRERRERRNKRKYEKKMEEKRREENEKEDFDFAKEEDPFAAWDAQGKEEIKSKKSKSEDKSEDEYDEEKEARAKAEMELLVMGEGNGGTLAVESGSESDDDFMKKKKKKKKMSRKARLRAKAQAKAKEAEAQKEVAKAVASDPRFAKVFTDSSFAIDTTHSRYKDSAVTKHLFDEKIRRRKKRQRDQDDGEREDVLKRKKQ
eukprot:g6179.t1